MARRKLTDEELQAASNAKLLWLKKKNKDRINQDDAAFALGMTTSAFSQYINGKIALNTDATAKFASYFGVHPREINPNWLSGVNEATPGTVRFKSVPQLPTDDAIQKLINASDRETLLPLVKAYIPNASKEDLKELLALVADEFSRR